MQVSALRTSISSYPEDPVRIGARVRLVCGADTASVFYQWTLRRQNVLVNLPYIETNRESGEMVIPEMKREHEGEWTCKAIDGKNKHRSSKSTFQLQVLNGEHCNVKKL